MGLVGQTFPSVSDCEEADARKKEKGVRDRQECLSYPDAERSEGILRTASSTLAAGRKGTIHYVEAGRIIAGEFLARLYGKGRGQRFVAFDRFLDGASTGPAWMKSPTISKMIVDALEFGESQRGLYGMQAFVVMSNHVHLLIETIEPIQKVTKLLKGYTARCGNRFLGRTGQAFWQDESFDHWVRNPAELARIIQYIEHNPVKAGLVQRPEDWPWSSAKGKKLGSS